MNDPVERGRLDIDPLVLRKIAEYAADQVPGTLPSERTVAGLGIGSSGAGARVRPGAGEPKAVDIRMELTLVYPAPVRSTIDAVRTRVTEELTRISGHHVRKLTVTVAGLRGAPAGPRLR